MIVLQDPRVAPCPEGIVAALGNFDGVHQGHRTLLSTAAEAASEMNGAKAAVITFFPHSAQALGRETRVLYTRQQKEELIQNTGQIELMICISFTQDLMQMPPEDFFEELLIKRLRVRGVVVGDNFRFGHKGSGDTALLQTLCERTGISCHIVPRVYQDGEAVSSTRIRTLVGDGDMKKAAALLGQPYYLRGIVQHGKHLGSRMEMPTINLYPEAEQLLPRKGVYVSRTYVGDAVLESLTNVGINPTVGGEPIRTETHILDFHEEVYGREIRIELLHYLRPEQKFEDLKTLRDQVAQDIQNTRVFFDRK